MPITPGNLWRASTSRQHNRGAMCISLSFEARQCRPHPNFSPPYVRQYIRSLTYQAGALAVAYTASCPSEQADPRRHATLLAR